MHRLNQERSLGFQLTGLNKTRFYSSRLQQAARSKTIEYTADKENGKSMI
jgi:hypothetical protein